MKSSLLYPRLFFFFLTLLFTMAYATSIAGSLSSHLLISLGLSLALFLAFISIDLLFHQFSLRAFNTTALGLFFGALMGKSLTYLADSLFDAGSVALALQPQTVEIIKLSLFLFGAYFGVVLTHRFAGEFSLSIPFLSLHCEKERSRDLLLDSSILSDPRLIDLASSGLVDRALLLPRFILTELHAQSESHDEVIKQKALRSLEQCKKLETLPSLQMRIIDEALPQTYDLTLKLLSLAKKMQANILTAEPAPTHLNVSDTRFISLHFLSTALKPILQTGEQIKMKIQRYGKEPKQGVGYLNDGTMVVVNGGGDYLGEVIEAKVLSVKQTSSGRMIFCNTLELNNPSQEPSEGANHV